MEAGPGPCWYGRPLIASCNNPGIGGEQYPVGDLSVEGWDRRVAAPEAANGKRRSRERTTIQGRDPGPARDARVGARLHRVGPGGAAAPRGALRARQRAHRHARRVRGGRAGGAHCPGTYLAGGYNRLETEIAGRVIENEDLVNWPNWLPAHLPARGRRLVLARHVEVLDFTSSAGRLPRPAGADRPLPRRARPRIRAGQPAHRPHGAPAPGRDRVDAEAAQLVRRDRDPLRARRHVRNENVARYQDLENQHLEVVGGPRRPRTRLPDGPHQPVADPHDAGGAHAVFDGGCRPRRRMRTVRRRTGASGSASPCRSSSRRSCGWRRSWRSAPRATSPSASPRSTRSRTSAAPAASPSCSNRTRPWRHLWSIATSRCTTATSRRS
jgi:hypothetical protein